jgi:hypothetical protein
MNAQQGTTMIAAQMTELLEQLDKPVFCKPLKTFHGSTIGQHFRHILEFYTCLFEGKTMVHPDTIGTAYVDYSSRKRNNILAENPKSALATLDFICHQVQFMNEHQILQIVSEFSENTEGGDRPVYVSSMGRELQYAFDHAVHHLAIIRIGLEIHFPQISVADDLGVAPSTLKYRAVADQQKATTHIQFLKTFRGN